MRVSNLETYVIKIRNDETYMGPPEAEAHIVTEDYFRRPHYPILFARSTETLLVKLTTDDGLVGWGEAQAPLAPEIPNTVIERLLRPMILGRSPHDVAVLWDEMFSSMRSRGQNGGFMLDAMAACDIAMWDLRGQALGLPLFQLLGGAHRVTVPVYVSGIPTAVSIEDRVEFIRTWMQQGFTSFKLKLGMGISRDIENVQAARDALGSDVGLMLDVHWRYNAAEALQLGRGLEKFGVAFLESPVWGEDLDGLADLARSLALPIAAGEEYRTRYAFRDPFIKRAVDLPQPDVGRCGVTELMRIAALAETFNLPIALHVGVGLGIYLAATVQVAAAIPNLSIMEHQPLMYELGNRMLNEPLVCRSGAYELPTAPGLGVVVDEGTLFRNGWVSTDDSTLAMGKQR